MKKTAILTTVALMACASASFAGTLTLTASPAGNTTYNWAVAKEKIDAAVAPGYDTVGVSLSGFTYSPNAYGSGTISNGALVIKFPAGITVAASGTNMAICDGTTVVANFQSVGVIDGSATNNALYFNATTGGGTGTFTNSIAYTLKDATCAAPTADTLTVTIPAGTAVVPLAVKSFISSNPAEPTGIDTAAAANFIGAVTEYSATVTTKMSQKIDPAAGFKTFLLGAVADTAVVTIAQNTTIDDPVVTDVTDVTTVKLVTTDATGAIAATFATTAPGVVATAQSADKMTSTQTVTDLASNAVGAYSFTLTANGTTPLNERPFTATAEMDFKAALPLQKDHLVANQTALLNAADAGNWAYDATTIYVPAIRTDNGGDTAAAETYIRIVSTDTTASTSVNKVSAVLYLDGPCNVSLNGGAQIPTFGQGFVVTGSQMLAAAATGTGTCTTTTIGGAVKAFAAKIIVTAGKGNVYAYGTQSTGNLNSQRRVPLLVDVEGSGTKFSPANN